MEFDAVILAGGRSSRLGGVPKAGLMVDGATLLAWALRAAGDARRIVIVGPASGDLPPGVLGCREDPPFSGPAAAIAAGLSALAAQGSGTQGSGTQGSGMQGPNGLPGGTVADAPAPLTLVLACDMPRVAGAVAALLDAAAEDPDGDPAGARSGLVAVSADGRTQPLVGLYDTAALQQAVADAARRNTLEGGSVFALLASLELRTIPVPPGSTDDVDTWDDASVLGAASPGAGTSGTLRPNSTLEANGEKPG
ncbi:NTP transferase domain-containing protein [uncultured Arthrobacter sp.]|uniref:molybdenum cofactor guanylyltransferase n=1 Tax=uncultured Arthrobacter sp. TaxID=114050 RepID=UPI0032175524